MKRYIIAILAGLYILSLILFVPAGALANFDRFTCFDSGSSFRGSPGSMFGPSHWRGGHHHYNPGYNPEKMDKKGYLEYHSGLYDRFSSQKVSNSIFGNMSKEKYIRFHSELFDLFIKFDIAPKDQAPWCLDDLRGKINMNEAPAQVMPGKIIPSSSPVTIEPLAIY